MKKNQIIIERRNKYQSRKTEKIKAIITSRVHLKLMKSKKPQWKRKKK
jgi:hypothetical protein